ncbi:hypothetical protein JAGODDHD_02311 [Sphingomonas paucimobilis]|nr:hypothetical protein [Sphingomonas paucimobilis]
MTRHLIVGRLGPSDRTRIPKAADEQMTQLAFGPADGLAFGIGHALDDLRKLGLHPSEIGADLLILAAHVHAADTRISRASEAQDGWTREIRLVVPVSDPAMWRTTELTVKRALDFLTGDRWQIGFRARPRTHHALVVAPDNRLGGIPYDGISLFSGGLDSLIGAIDRLSAGHAPLFVSHAGESAVSSSQEACFKGLKRHFKRNDLDRLRVWMTFENGLVEDVASESTTRGRSFLFFALAAAAGSGLGRQFEIQVPENGLIALNVPLDQLRLGAPSTRTTHPFHIARWNDLLRQLGISGLLVNPYWNKTKGEMASECAEQALLMKLAASSLSCSSPAKARWLGLPQGHCGHCLPCLIRRASLLGRDPTPYILDDLKSVTLDTRKAEGIQVRSFQLAIERMRRKPDLAATLVHKPGSLADVPHQTADLADVYRRGLAEVGRLLKGVRAAPG